MSPRGPRPKPAILKINAGNPGRRPINDSVKSKKINPNPPRWLEKTYHREWAAAADMLSRIGILTETDLMAFEMLIVIYCKWKKAEKLAKIEVLTSATGNVTQNPYINIANKYAVQLYKLLAEFGMTPSARTKVTPVKELDTTFQDFLHKKNA